MTHKKGLTINELITKHSLKKDFLAREMGMPVGTFKNKALDSLPAYHFTAGEEKRLLEILRAMAEDIKHVKLTEQ